MCIGEVTSGSNCAVGRQAKINSSTSGAEHGNCRAQRNRRTDRETASSGVKFRQISKQIGVYLPHKEIREQQGSKYQTSTLQINIQNVRTEMLAS
jgi:hypothetical protein